MHSPYSARQCSIQAGNLYTSVCFQYLYSSSFWPIRNKPNGVRCFFSQFTSSVKFSHQVRKLDCIFKLYMICPYSNSGFASIWSATKTANATSATANRVKPPPSCLTSGMLFDTLRTALTSHNSSQTSLLTNMNDISVSTLLKHCNLLGMFSHKRTNWLTCWPSSYSSFHSSE